MSSQGRKIITLMNEKCFSKLHQPFEKISDINEDLFTNSVVNKFKVQGVGDMKVIQLTFIELPS